MYTLDVPAVSIYAFPVVLAVIVLIVAAVAIKIIIGLVKDKKLRDEAKTIAEAARKDNSENPDK